MSRRTFYVLLSATVIILALAAVLYVSKEYNRFPVRIGVVLPLSGDYEIYGNMGLQGVKMAVQEDDVTAIVGPVSSAALAAMTEVAGEFKTPLLYGIDYESTN